MAIFNKIFKQRLSWQAPQSVAVGLPEVDFVFSDNSDFVFSDNSDYVFKEATSGRSATQWVLPSKQRLSWQS